MKEKDFLEMIKEELEIEEEITMETKFREEIEDWCSLLGFSLLALIEREAGKIVRPDKFIKAETFRDVYELLD